MKIKSKLGILSLGCPRNQVDSEFILGRLNLKGYPLVDIERADTVIVNTCAFIEDAKKESIEAILDLIDLKKQGKLKRIIVYGCLVQRYKGQLIRHLSEVDAFVGTVSLNHQISRFPLGPKHYAYLKICEGCIHRCSYCIIPQIKNKFRSLDVNCILNRVEAFEKERISELNIIGQDITGYGIDLYGRCKLAELLNTIRKKINNIGWIRLLYLYPDPILEEILEIMRDEPRICRYIDLPIQHINDRILKMMRRGINKKGILELIDKIRKRLPDAVIRTSLIVGFPSETDREFQELLRFVEDVKFERLGAFIYSAEEGTPAYHFKGKIPHKIKAERLSTLMLKQQDISQQINKQFLNKTLEVLIDEKTQDSYYLGRTQYDAPEVDGIVYVKSRQDLTPGDFVKVKIRDTLEYDLVGELN
ncbi:MAG: 30S ribosomal protein S12 methylthiotransferase RimO [Candidatus Omnitrophica bacterium]|nr:30S ribosomal protein S12 methylthiotransferase RimO [Candidatus Omnitrophota bacterium]